jgi:hypothetical protein
MVANNPNLQIILDPDLDPQHWLVKPNLIIYSVTLHYLLVTFVILGMLSTRAAHLPFRCRHLVYFNKTKYPNNITTAHL